MKKKYLLTALWLCIAAFITGRSMAQVKLPTGFEQNARIKYNAFKHKEISFERFLKQEEAAYIEQQNLANGVSAVYNGCDELTNTPCGNGDFESGVIDPAQWDGAFGPQSNVGTVDFSLLTEGISGGVIGSANSRQTIVTAGNDETVGALLSRVAPGGSTRALRIGNAAGGEATELISKRFTVSANQTIINFMYALVLEDPANSGVQHTAEGRPSFWVRVVNCNTGLEIPNVVNLGNGQNQVFANANDPFFQSFNGGQVAWRNWSCGLINLSTVPLGTPVCVQFITQDCDLLPNVGTGGHFGYAYIDNLCGICQPPGGGALSLASRTDCGPGQICLNYTLQNMNTVTGTLQLSLQIYQNGMLLQTVNSPTLNTGSSYCFNVNPATIPGINDALTGFDFVVTGNFVLSGFTSTVILGNPPTGQISGQNNDYRIYCIDQCCPGRNRVRNPGFEEGNLYFSTAYNYQPAVFANSVMPGRYGLLTSNQSVIVSPTWDVDCIANGKHLIINGATGTGLNKIAWMQNVTVTPGKTYKFCADMKNLPQCAFDVLPKVDVVFSVGGGSFDILDEIINVPNGNCNWQEVTSEFTIPGSGPDISMGIRIYLDETAIGDGNDLAIDNITLVEIDQVPTAELLFNVNLFDVTGSTFSIAAEPVAPLGKDCGFYWEVGEVDDNGNYLPCTAVYNPAQWWPLNPNTFNGYNGTCILSGNNPGVFGITKRYRIVYGRWCECQGWNSYAVILDPMKKTATGQTAIEVRPDSKFTLTPSQIKAIMNGEYSSPAGEAVYKAAPVAANVQSAGAKIKLYPNPADDVLTVELPAGHNGKKLVLYDTRGAVVNETAVTPGAATLRINIEGLEQGAYWVRLAAAGGQLSPPQQFIKLKQ